ncbi:unnamed protein product [Adineta ricciae]|uniref:Uncharacterized protein n=2 Tax=Adineta ricciae TaxID=249248 RepID=A0A815WEH2_ADIRI|nr:unnamed protein product [Adineta ricciae]
MINPNQFVSLQFLIIFKYATNVDPELIIDFILRIPQLKSCQIKNSQSHGRIPIIPLNYDRNTENLLSTLEYFDMESKSPLSFVNFYSNILRYTPNIQYFNGFVTHRRIHSKIRYEPIDNLTHLSTLILRSDSIEFEQLHLLSQSTQNLRKLQLDCLTASSDRSFLNNNNWIQCLSSWKYLRYLKIYISKQNIMLVIIIFNIFVKHFH